MEIISMPFTGEKIIYYSKCESTNTIALNLATTQQVCEGTVLITDEQTKGRGQRGSQWVTCPYQNLTFSILFYPTFLPLQDAFFLYIISALGICEALLPGIQHGLSIKWPNDIYFLDKKLGGILIENVVQGDVMKASVIGVGLNVNQTTFTDLPGATSLAAITSERFSLPALLAQLTAGIEKQYSRLRQHQLHALKQDYLRHLYGLHTISTFQDQQGRFQGVIQGIDDSGRLVIDALEQGLKYYTAKEVAYVTS